MFWKICFSLRVIRDRVVMSLRLFPIYYFFDGAAVPPNMRERADATYICSVTLPGADGDTLGEGWFMREEQRNKNFPTSSLVACMVAMDSRGIHHREMSLRSS